MFMFVYFLFCAAYLSYYGGLDLMQLKHDP